MRMTGEERIAAPRGRVWEALNDPEVLRQCIPGCQSLEKESAERLRAVVEVKIGPIGARFNGVVALSDIDAPRSYTLTGEGQGGTVGSAKTSIKVRLAEEGSVTVLAYEVDATVGGRLAQLGGPLIDATAKQFAGRFFRKFGELLAGTATVAAPSASVSAAPAASRGLPIAWILALAVSAMVGFFVGRSQGSGGSDWMGMAIGLLIVIVAAAGFEFGRRSAAPQIVLDAALLERLLRADKRSGDGR